MNTDKCNDDQMCVNLEKQIVPFEKSGFVLWEKVIDKRVQLCGVGYKKTPKSTPFLISVCPWCGAHPGFEFPSKATGDAS
jgi:hypothetical protein